jgi:hypothetical protein
MQHSHDVEAVASGEVSSQHAMLGRSVLVAMTIVSVSTAILVIVRGLGEAWPAVFGAIALDIFLVRLWQWTQRPSRKHRVSRNDP